MNKLISKTLFYLLLIGTLIHSGGLHAQTIDLTKKISINAVDTPLEAVLEEIARITDLNFSYSLDQIPYDKKITIRAENKSIRWVLNKISKEANINYVIVENQIVLKAKSVKVDLDDDGKPIVKHTISGYVRDQESGEFLISASVFIEDLFIGTSTNEFGFYSLTLPEGEYTIKFSYVGYNLMPLTVDLFNSVVKDVALLLDFNELTEVEVESE
ncbi:MAG: carboxypeptidase-like regulatory domain-containing protein, partial [Bacteroidetes bacterium]|nr:carboxypeptidase-like regulatory domain-containing protein [Bacteroidota bacterium]